MYTPQSPRILALEEECTPVEIGKRPLLVLLRSSIYATFSIKRQNSLAMIASFQIFCFTFGPGHLINLRGVKRYRDR